MSRATLNTYIDTNVTSKTVADSLTPTDEGNALKAVADYTDYLTPYLSYSALISQSGTSAPTAKVLNNNTGVTFSFTRNSAGNYSLTGSSNVFTTDKTATIYAFNSNGSFASGTMFFYTIGAQFFTIETRNSGTSADSIITDSFIEIRIYS